VAPPPTVVAAIDAGVPEPTPAKPALTCDSGHQLAQAKAPEPTWYCARPDGVRDGAFVTRFPDGTPQVTGSYVNDKLDGPWERHAPDGQVIEAGSYAAGQRTGKWTLTSTTGKPLGDYELKNGSGVEKRWYDDGALYSERKLKAGVAFGPEKLWAPDGVQLVNATWFAGRLDGAHWFGSKANLRVDETLAGGVRRGNRQIWQFWSLTLDENYDTHGRRDGDYTIWRSKKVPRVHGTYDHGKRDGLWTWTDRDNNKEREGNYVDGKKDGAWTEWSENKISFTGNYVQGKPDGDFIYYDRNQNELGRFTMKNGSGVMETFWPNKKVASKQHVYAGNNDGLYQELTNRGKVVVEGHFRGDAKSGSWKEWTPDGVPTLEQGWKRGRLDGVVKKYIDGQVASETTYKDGKAIGKYTEYRDGKPALTGQFADDRRTGTWTRYAGDGRVLLTSTYKDGVLDGPWKQLVDGAVVEGTMTAGRRTGTWKRTDKSGAVRETSYAAAP
jgi:antitoxin component YwqK of YwqJK toxin-antitoxin module